MEWQYYPKWHWPWYSKLKDEDFNIYLNFAGIGPLQFRWYSNAKASSS